MTIDEAIEIYEKRAKSIERSFSRGAWADGGHKTSLMEVAADHRQLAEWLRELKNLKTKYSDVQEKIREIRGYLEFAEEHMNVMGVLEALEIIQDIMNQ